MRHMEETVDTEGESREKRVIDKISRRETNEKNRESGPQITRRNLTYGRGILMWFRPRDLFGS